MKKRLGVFWFLEDPIDTEHKEYVLLDYLKSISKDLNSENSLRIIKEISRLVRILSKYRQIEGPIEKETWMDKKDLIIIENFNRNFRFY